MPYIHKCMQMHPVYSHLRFCTFNMTQLHIASHRIFEHFLALVGQLGHLSDMKSEKVLKKIVQIFRTASSTCCPPDQPTKTIHHQPPLKSQRELLKVTNQRCVGRSACTLRSSFSAELRAGHHIVSAGDLRNPEWMWLHFFLLASALWWPVMSDPVTSNGAASCYDTNATQATGAGKVIGKSLLVLIAQEVSWLSWENDIGE